MEKFTRKIPLFQIFVIHVQNKIIFKIKQLTLTIEKSINISKI
jgi:hypothetical protein